MTRTPANPLYRLLKPSRMIALLGALTLGIIFLNTPNTAHAQSNSVSYTFCVHTFPYDEALHAEALMGTAEEHITVEMHINNNRFSFESDTGSNFFPFNFRRSTQPCVDAEVEVGKPTTLRYHLVRGWTAGTIGLIWVLRSGTDLGEHARQFLPNTRENGVLFIPGIRRIDPGATIEWIIYPVSANEVSAIPPKPKPVVGISSDSATMDEGTTASFTLTAEPPPTAALQVAVAIDQAGDFVSGDQTGSRTVTIGTNGIGTLSVATDDDDQDEENGAITVTVTVDEAYTVSGTAGSASVAVNDNDDLPLPVISIAAGPEIEEGGTATFTLTSNPPPHAPFEVTVLVSDEPGEFIAGSGTRNRTVIIDTDGTGILSIPTDDDEVDEENGTISALGQDTETYTFSALGGSAFVLVRDNDGPPPSSSIITITPGSEIAEGTEGPEIEEGQTATFTLRADPPPASPLEVSVLVSESGAFTEFDQIGFRTVIIDTDGIGTLTVMTVKDEAIEPDGAITVAVRDGDGYSGGASASVKVKSVNPRIPATNAYAYRLCALDDGLALDGDNVDIYVNGELILDNHVLTREEACSRIVLYRNPTKNRIRVHAISGGTSGPNTAQLRIRHATSDAMLPLAQARWDIEGGDDEEWDVYAFADDDVRLQSSGRSPQQQAVQSTVAAVAAATVSNVTSNIGTRFSAPSTGGASVSLAGMPVVFGSDDLNYPGSLSLTDRFDAFGEETWQSRQRTMSGSELLRSSSFEIALGAALSDNVALPGTRLTVWGRGDFQFFESGGGKNSGYDGGIVAGYLGADFTTPGGWLTGLAVSRISAEADYTLANAEGSGKLEAELTNIHPYIRFAVDDRSEAWAILGLGSGEVTDTAKDGPRNKSDMSMKMASAGARHLLSNFIGIDWALLADGSLATVETDEGVQSVDGISADVWRARVGAEASYTTVWDSGASLTSFLEIAARQDGGDGTEGVGLELSPGLSLSDSESGFTVQARGRALALHSADNHREYGASITVSKSATADGQGLSLALTPTWGTPDKNLDPTGATGLFPRSANDVRSDALSLNSRIAYGFAAGKGVVSPFAELSLHQDDSRQMRIGSRYSLGHAVDLELFGAQSSHGSGDAEHSMGLTSRIRF